MTNEIRQFTDKQIIEVFARTKKTANVKVYDVEYFHYEQFPDTYKVNTDNGSYFYQRLSNITGKMAEAVKNTTE